MKTVLERFLDYVRVDTESAYNVKTAPSTERQRDFALVLAEELRSLGAKDAYVSKSACVYARIPANCAGAPAIGFCSHIDTTPEFSGRDVKPRIVKNYGGGDVVLNEEKNIVMKAAQFPHLKNYIGKDLVVSDGTTLLGADDKAGLAEIMTMLEYFAENPKEKHGEIQIFFPSDEEVGCIGAETLDKSRFNPDFAYTLDGGPIGEITYETFNAASAVVTVKGINIHPGLAKNQMKNAVLIAREFADMLPDAETPARTEGYEGYYHLISVSGEVELTTMKFYIRDHDKAAFAARKKRLKKAADFLNSVYGGGTVAVEITDTYKNIREAIEPRFEIVEAAAKAMEEEGVKPFYVPMRGGTDGTILSFKGIPCPNICVGGHNYHGKYEYVPVQSMEKIVSVLVRMVTGFAKEKEKTKAKAGAKAKTKRK